MNDCQNCSTLQTEVNRLQQENKRLLKRLEKLLKVLTHIGQQCADVISRSDAIMSEHQPRGRWSFAKGARATAYVVKRFIDAALAG